MTNKRNIGREVESVKDGVLSDLAPSERATMAVRRAAAGDVDHVEELRRTAPVDEYRAVDLAFIETSTDHLVYALAALRELEAGAWRFFYTRMQALYEDTVYTLHPDAEWTTEPGPENEYHEANAMRAAGWFYADYLKWKRYAEDDVGVTLEEFLLHPFVGTAREVLEPVEEVARLANGRALAEEPDDVDGGWATHLEIEYQGEQLSPEEVARRKYDRLTNSEGRLVEGL